MNRNPGMPFDPRRAFAGLFALATAAAAGVVDLSNAHAGNHADSLIPVLTSLYHWEPYYWGTDRNGQLLPLLAAPWDHPLTNLLVQVGLSVFAGIAALGFFARLVAPSCWPAVAAGAWALVLFGYTEYVRFNMLNPCQPYAASMLCAGAGLWAVSGTGRGPVRWALAVALFALAGWVNIGLAMNLGPWLLFGWLLTGRAGPAGGRRTDFLRGAGLLAFGTAVGMSLKRLSHYPGTPLTILPSEKWMTGWDGVARDLWTHFGTNLALSLALIAVGLVWLVRPATRSLAVRRTKAGVAAVAALVVGFAFVGTTDWAASNGYTARYLFPSLMLLNVAAAGAALGPPLEVLGPTYRWRLGAAAVLLVPAMPLTVYGWPSVAKARAALEPMAGSYTPDVLTHRCTHVSGSYWDVWPTVFCANLALADRGEHRVVWGIAPRADATRPKWSAVPTEDVRLGWLVPRGQTDPPPATAATLQPEFPQLRLAERAPALWLYVTEPSKVAAREPDQTPP